jgi:hypothetical protein
VSNFENDQRIHGGKPNNAEYHVQINKIPINAEENTLV